jgi:DinB family protein
MPTMEDYAKQPIADRLKRLERTPDELAAAIKGQSAAALTRRPDEKNWAPVEVVCHLRDTEEGFAGRFQMLLAMEDPKLFGPDPDRWAVERQYLRNDAGEALAAFRKRRGDSLDILRRLTPEQWKRGGIHPARGRITIEDFLTLMAWHDDNHLDQLGRALAGKA